MAKKKSHFTESPCFVLEKDVSSWASAPWGSEESTHEGLHAAFSTEAHEPMATVCTPASESSPAKRPTKPAMCEHNQGYSEHLSFWDREKDAQPCEAGRGYRSSLADDPVHGAIQG